MEIRKMNISMDLFKDSHHGNRQNEFSHGTRRRKHKRVWRKVNSPLNFQETRRRDWQKAAPPQGAATQKDGLPREDGRPKRGGLYAIF
jgi:hypothetical protein